MHKANYSLRVALDEADKVLDTFGLNVRGNSLALLKRAAEENPDVSRDELDEVWDDIGEDLIREDTQGCEGHMSNRDIVILMESCKELIPVVLAECNTWDEVTYFLEGKE